MKVGLISANTLTIARLLIFSIVHHNLQTDLESMSQGTEDKNHMLHSHPSVFHKGSFSLPVKDWV